MSCEIDNNINYLISKIRELENENKSLKQEITELKTENAYLDTNYLTAMNRIDELEVMLESHFD